MEIANNIEQTKNVLFFPNEIDLGKKLCLAARSQQLHRGNGVNVVLLGYLTYAS